MCKAILAIAGPEVESELRASEDTQLFLVKILSSIPSPAKDFSIVFGAVSDYVECGDVYQSQTGSYPCSALLHVCGKNDAALIEEMVVDIIDRCESLEVASVAIPALRTGELSFRIDLDRDVNRKNPLFPQIRDGIK